MIPDRVSNSSARLAVSMWGDEGPSILALHPGVADSRIWQWSAPTWAEAGHRVVAYDRRGFGRTEYEAEDHDDLADLLAVAAATRSTPAVIVGNSRGGGLAIDLALAHPDQVDALVLIAPSITGYDYSTWPTSTAEAEQDDLLATAEAAADLDLVNRLETRYWLDGVDQPEGRVGGPARDLMLDMNGLALGAGPIGEAAKHPPVRDRLGDIDVPVLVVVGRYDLPGIVRQCHELVDAIPSARLTTMAESAHCPALDSPTELADLVIDFLSATRR